MTREQFIEMLDISAEGHYPFTGILEDGGQLTMMALALPNMQTVYEAVYNFLQLHPSATKVYFSADFSPKMDVTTDFVACFFYEGGEWDVTVIPYDAEGNRQTPITNTELTEGLIKQSVLSMEYFKERDVRRAAIMALGGGLSETAKVH